MEDGFRVWLDRESGMIFLCCEHVAFVPGRLLVTAKRKGGVAACGAERVEGVQGPGVPRPTQNSAK